MSITVGRFLVELLAANDIDTVFGIPGVHTLELYRGLAASSLRHVLVRHEQGAGFAADGYARISGRAAAAFVISGPGLTNILTAVGQAYSDSVPLLVVASTPALSTLGKQWGVLHELREQRALAADVFGVARHAQSAADVRDHLRACLASLGFGRRRPAYLGIPLDVLAQTTELRAERFPDGAAAPAPDPVQVAAAVRLIADAARPLIVAGGGAVGAEAALRRLVETTGAMLVTTAAGKGLLPEDHPANLGAALPYKEARELTAAADVILAVGTELAETDLYWTLRLPLSGRLIRVDLDRVKLCDHYAAEVPLWGDARAALEAINDGLSALRAEPAAGAANPDAGPTATVGKAWRAAAGGAAAIRAAIEAGFTEPMRTQVAALRAIRAGLPENAVVFSDMTQIAYLGNYQFPCARPGRWFHPSGYGTLGYALPAAIGAKIAAPDRAVLALVGDYGLQFTINELITAVERAVGLPIVVWNNSALGQIRDDMIAAGIPPLGVVGRNPDFLALATAYGAGAVRARDPLALSTAIESALVRTGPTLIEVVDTDFQQ